MCMHASTLLPQAKFFTSCSFSLFRIKRHVARSGPELVRYQSRGTNINPFTPAEQRDKASPAAGGRASLFVANSEPKPHKVRR